MRSRHPLGVMAGLLCLAAHALATTKTVEVGPNGALIFLDEESGTHTTTITAGDTVQWVWMSSGHSSTRTDTPKTWDSGIQNMPFSFSQTFPDPGRYPYHCTPHESLGMLGTVVVEPAGGTTTTTTLPPQACTDTEAVANARAQVPAQCDCGGAATHGAYVRCAAHVLKAAVEAGTLPKAYRGAVKKCAAKSTCGKPGFVTCCRTTAKGVQTCNIKRSAAACKAPKRGRACVGDQPSCCDACGGTTCPTVTRPRPRTTTTTAPSTTTTTLLSPQCFVDADCGTVSQCGGIGRCVGGVCVAETAALCSDGTPVLWFGTATSLAGFVNVAFAICGVDPIVFGTFFCLPGSLSCFGAESPAFATTFISVDGIAILFDPFVFAEGVTCTFNGLLVGLTMGGDFFCVDSFEFIVSAGAWSASRCP